MSTPPERRPLRFESYDEILDEVRHLHEAGYQRLGNWSLGQTCDHLAIVHRGALEGIPGFKFLLPLRPFMRKVMLPRFEKNARFPNGIKAPPIFQPPAQVDDAEAIDAFVEITHRLQNQKGPLKPSPIFGNLGHDGWRRLNCLHASHHLSLLIPNAVNED